MNSVGTHEFSHLFEPLTIRGVVFKNRVMAALLPVGQMICPGGVPAPEAVAEIEARARGGAASVTVGEVFVGDGRGVPFGGGLALTDPKADGRPSRCLFELAEIVGCHGAAASLLLNHTGAANHPNAIEGHRSPVGPTGHLRADGVTVEEMTQTEMRQTADAFAAAAYLAKEAGFRMVTLQGGGGWLLQQFLSPLTNRRSDRFGGSFENRARFPLMVVKAVREAVGASLPVEYILSAEEGIDGGLQTPEAVSFCRLIQDDVDVIQVTGGRVFSAVESKLSSSMYHDHGCNLALAEAVKREELRALVAAVGGFNQPDQLERALAEGKCDLVALGRQMIADPDFVRKTAEGREKEIAPCLRCSCYEPEDPCTGMRYSEPPFQCAVNPCAFRSVRVGRAPGVVKKQKVLVVGGGPGGMVAAATAAERGHTVRLVERRDKLGGLLWCADADCHKADLARYRDSLIARCKAAGVEVVLKTAVTRPYIEKTKPDAVILAIGAEPALPPIPGLAVFSHHVLWAYGNTELVGRRVAIIGSGPAGMECALHLAETSQSEVTVLGRSFEYARSARASHREALELFLPQSVTVKGGVHVTAVRPGGVTYRARNGRTVDVEADTILYAVGMLPRRAEALELLSAHPNTRLIGDCREPADVASAVRDGFFAAYDLI